MAINENVDNVVALKRARPSLHRRPAGYALIAAALIFLIPAMLDAWSEIRIFTQFRAATCTILGKRLAQPDGLDRPAPEFTLRLDVGGRQRIAAAFDFADAPQRYALWQDYPCW